jgi:hypothetical protein
MRQQFVCFFAREEFSIAESENLGLFRAFDVGQFFRLPRPAAKVN